MAHQCVDVHMQSLHCSMCVTFRNRVQWRRVQFRLDRKRRLKRRTSPKQRNPTQQLQQLQLHLPHLPHRSSSGEENESCRLSNKPWRQLLNISSSRQRGSRRLHQQQNHRHRKLKTSCLLKCLWRK